MYFGGGADSNSVQLWRDLHDAAPDVLLIGSHNLLVPEFYGRIGAAAARTYLTSVAQDPSQLPARGQRFLRDYRREFGEPPDRFAAYGHAAMTMLLDAIGRAGNDADERDRVVEETLATTDFDSAVGKFSIDDNGDTSLDRIAGYRVRGDRLVFAASLRGEPAPASPSLRPGSPARARGRRPRRPASRARCRRGAPRRRPPWRPPRRRGGRTRSG